MASMFIKLRGNPRRVMGTREVVERPLDGCAFF